ncbi:MAG: RNA repair transcriptional activator RtcR [Deltaproteobacteria bacterium]|nr:RNA repair transcriptional activator RtcR [Deltaproteobacteria bacterium]
MTSHSSRSQIVLGLIGITLDSGSGPERWERWRPTVALCQHEDFVVDRLELLVQKRHRPLAESLRRDIGNISPETETRIHELEFDDPWDFEEVYGALHDFALSYPFEPEEEDYLLHITTGTHVAQICLFLLAESRHFPARLLQTGPPRRSRGHSEPGTRRIIDLDLSRYDRIAQRFHREQSEALSFLKAGIETRNPAFNQLIERIEYVAVHSQEPILLTGPTGAGKSRLAQRIFELKKQRHQVAGEFVEVNCATLRGDGAMSALFGHRRGAFTGALQDRPGLLLSADKGVLFLDEIGELGLDEQAMLLRALEEKRFLPVGADQEVGSEFQLLAGTNRHLASRVREGRFRDDLLARIDLWTFELPGLQARPEDIEPNLDYELQRFSARSQEVGSKTHHASMNTEARRHFLRFATSGAPWHGNFRDLNAAVIRMGTLAPGGRVDAGIVQEEIARLEASWSRGEADTDSHLLQDLLGAEGLNGLDRFDRVQLAEVIRVCRASPSLAAAGRKLFAVSRSRKKQPNDADRIRKYLARFGLSWSSVAPDGSP